MDMSVGLNAADARYRFDTSRKWKLPKVASVMHTIQGTYLGRKKRWAVELGTQDPMELRSSQPHFLGEREEILEVNSRCL